MNKNLISVLNTGFCEINIIKIYEDYVNGIIDKNYVNSYIKDNNNHLTISEFVFFFEFLKKEFLFDNFEIKFISNIKNNFYSFFINKSSIDKKYLHLIKDKSNFLSHEKINENIQLYSYNSFLFIFNVFINGYISRYISNKPEMFDKIYTKNKNIFLIESEDFLFLNLANIILDINNIYIFYKNNNFFGRIETYLKSIFQINNVNIIYNNINEDIIPEKFINGKKIIIIDSIFYNKYINIFNAISDSFIFIIPPERVKNNF